MSTLLSAQSLSKSHGSNILFEEVSFTVSEADRIGLIGPNGSGKSTLLKILYGAEDPDSGIVSKRSSLKIGYASQMPHFDSISIEEILIRAVPHLSEEEARTRSRILLSKAQFEQIDQNASTLSGGWKKRLDIARAMMQEPDLLLLDEPTNHLDLEGILWLEKFLQKERIAYIVISHDRTFLEQVCNRVLELNKCYPGGLFSSDGGMKAFYEHKEAFLQGQLEQQRSLSTWLRDEMEWLRRSPKARTSKSKARVQKAQETIERLSEIKARNKTTKVEIDFTASERETRKLLSAKNITKSIEGKMLFKGIDLTLSPGSRVGIVGKNGTGKTTLLKILAGKVAPDLGTIKYADDLHIVYFDQHREHLPSTISLKEALSPNGDMVNYRGQPIHVNGWAKRFLFSPDKLMLPVGCLSGGERARILIARLMLQPADLLFLDEPTNDLDIPTLEVIEESLLEFTGAVVLITHDRSLMDRVCTEIIGLGEGLEQTIYADYPQWERAIEELSSTKKKTLSPSSSPLPSTKPKKLSYLEQKELSSIEETIMHAESKVEEIQTKLHDPAIQSDTKKSLELYQNLGNAQKEVEALYERWQYLESKSKGL